MTDKGRKRQIIKRHLFSKKRLIILNEDTFAEVFSLRLTLMNVFVVATLGAVLIIFVTTYIIAFTPLREFIPGYASNKLRKDATELALKSDSLANALKKNQAYLQSVVKVLNGDLQYAKVNKDSILATKTDAPSIESAGPTKAELELRAQIDKEEQAAKKALQKKKVKKRK